MALENQSPWETTTNRFVAFFDIMGFKDMVMTNNHAHVLNQVNTLKKSTEMLIDGTMPGLEMITNLKSFQFSDSLFIFTASNSKKDLLNLLHQSRILLSFCFKQKIPLKGAISYGEITANFIDSIFVGQPIIDAYLLHEELHMFGAIMDHHVERIIREAHMDKEFLNSIDEQLVRYKVPTKSGKIFHYCLKWPLISVPLENGGTALNLIDKYLFENFYTTVSGRPRIYVDNTIEFIDSLIDGAKK